jgi:hypothetical protein
MKICKICNREFPETKEFFYIDHCKFRPICKCCANKRVKELRIKNKEKIQKRRKEYRIKNKEKISGQQKEYYKRNKDKVIKKAMNYAKNNKEKIKVRREKYQEKNRDRLNKEKRVWRKNNKDYINDRYKTDEIFRIKARIRSRIRKTIKTSGNIKDKKIIEYGIDLEKIAKCLGPCPGDYKDWDIDHIFPIHAFNLNNKFELWAAYHPTNHQWLLHSENISKNCFYNEKLFKLYINNLKKEYEEINK